MKYAQTTVEFVLITLVSVILAIIIADSFGFIDYARRTIFATTNENGAVEVPSMVH